MKKDLLIDFKKWIYNKIRKVGIVNNDDSSETVSAEAGGQNYSYKIIFKRYAVTCNQCGCIFTDSCAYCPKCGMKQDAHESKFAKDLKKHLTLLLAIFVSLSVILFAAAFFVGNKESNRQTELRDILLAEKKRIEDEIAERERQERERIEKEKAEWEAVPETVINSVTSQSWQVVAYSKNIPDFNKQYRLVIGDKVVWETTTDKCQCFFGGISFGPYLFDKNELFIITTSSNAAGAPWTKYEAFIVTSNANIDNAVYLPTYHKHRNSQAVPLEEQGIYCQGDSPVEPIITEKAIEFRCAADQASRSPAKRVIFHKDGFAVDAE